MINLVQWFKYLILTHGTLVRSPWTLVQAWRGLNSRLRQSTKVVIKWKWKCGVFVCLVLCTFFPLLYVPKCPKIWFILRARDRHSVQTMRHSPERRPSPSRRPRSRMSQGPPPGGPPHGHPHHHGPPGMPPGHPGMSPGHPGMPPGPPGHGPPPPGPPMMHMHPMQMHPMMMQAMAMEAPPPPTPKDSDKPTPICRWDPRNWAYPRNEWMKGWRHLWCGKW